MLSGCDVRRPESVESALLAISRLNDGVQALLFDPNKLAPTYPASMILRPPKFNAYYDVMQVKPVNAATWRLEVSGLVADKRAWTLSDLQALPQASIVIQHYLRRGLELYRRLDRRPAAPLPRTRRCGSPGQIRRLQDGRRLPEQHRHASALHPQTLLALKYGDDTLADPFGYPLRLRTAVKRDYKNPKWVTAIELTNKYPGGYWESLGFSWFAGI